MRTHILVWILAVIASPVAAAEREEILAGTKKAVRFYHEHVSTEGGYLWAYSADLKLKEGEGKVETKTVWVQPPGTPAVGEAYVRLYEATGDRLFLDAALAAADVLRRGQLRSGGWNASIELAPQQRKGHAYRIDPPGKKNSRNNSSLDDDKTQSALRFLIRLDKALEFKNEMVHETTRYALDHLLAAQYPNGAFPQGWQDPYDPAQHPVKKASFPQSWPREYPGHQNYWFRYTLNDDLVPDLLAVLYLAEDAYDDKKYGEAARKLGDFLIAAQLPDPQPAWAQQYDFDMHPAWARKFEPAAVTGGESQGAMRALMTVYRHTGDAKYLEPIPRALAYLKKSQLPDGKLARFYELETNRPLYFTREYVLTYDDSDLPTHYGFKVGSNVDRIEREYQALLKTPQDQLRPRPRKIEATRERQRRAEAAIAALDERGAWVAEGQLKYHKVRGKLIDMRAAVENLGILADYLEATSSG